MMSLSELGPRICIVGPSCAGKSTLAAALSRKLGVPAVHIDQLHRLADRDWRKHPSEEFTALVHAVISGDEWIVEGDNRHLQPRLARASGIIWLDTPRWTGLVRYAKRSWFDRVRYGRLDAAADRVTWRMIRFIVMQQTPERRSLAELLAATRKPTLRIASVRELNGYYRYWGLSSPSAARAG